MGLDAYIYKSEGIKCLHCGEMIFPIPEHNGEEICYWRKNWDLQHFINNEITPYDDDQYDKFVEIPVDGVRKMLRFLSTQDYYEAGGDNMTALKAALFDIEEGRVKLFYSANW